LIPLLLVLALPAAGLWPRGVTQNTAMILALQLGFLLIHIFMEAVTYRGLILQAQSGFTPPPRVMLAATLFGFSHLDTLFRRRVAGVRAALGVRLVLACVELRWSYTLHYKLPQPDFYVYYLAAQLGRVHGWAAVDGPAVFLPPVTGAIGNPLPYLDRPELPW